MNLNNPDLLDKLAAEYVLGAMRGGARRRFAQYAQASPNVRAAIAKWEARLLPLSQSIAPVQPAVHVWRNIQQRTQDPAWRPQSSNPLLATLARLFGGACAGAALTAALVLYMPQQFISLEQLAQQQQQLPQSYVGLLTDQHEQPVLLASSTRHGNKMTVKWLRAPGTLAIAPHTRLQLWAFPVDKDGKALAPFIVGTLTAPDKVGNTEFFMSASAEKLLANVKRLAVAPAERAQADTPPAEFILRGHCTKLW